MTLPVVVSGMSGRFSNSRNIDEFEHNLYNKVDMVDGTEKRFRHTNPEVQKRSGKIIDVQKFDATFFGVGKKLATVMDPQMRLMNEVAYEAILDAGVNPKSLAGSNTGVYSTFYSNDTLETWGFHDNDSDVSMIGNTRCMSANWISYYLDLKGPSMYLDTGCSSSGYAIDLACSAIQKGEIDSAVVVGTSLIFQPYTTLHFGRLGVLSKEGYGRSFDDAASGYVRGECVVAMFLQRKDVAKRIYSEVVFRMTCNDGYKPLGITRTSAQWQQCMLEKALEVSKLNPDDFAYAEAHGTGTRVGDEQETAALDMGVASLRKSPLLIGSTKTNMGHAENASGLTSLVKIHLAFEKGVIAPNLYFNKPNRNIKGLLEGRLKVVTEPTKLEKPYIILNNFGFGGSNSLIFFKQHQKTKKNMEVKLPVLVLWSGRTKEAVETMFNDIQTHSLDPEHIALLHNIQKTPNLLYPARGYGIFSKDEATGKTKTITQKVRILNEQKRPIVWVFSGMGSAWNQMGADLLRLPVFRESFEKCAEITKKLGIDLLEVFTSKNPEIFGSIQNCLVGITTMQICLTNLLKSLNIVPDMFIGHSAGEVACGYADGVLTEEQAINASYYRGNPKSNFVGAMAAVGLSHRETQPMLPSDIDIACHNSSTSCTISGPLESVKSFVAELNKKSIFAKQIDSAGKAYHSRYVAEILDDYKKFMKINVPNPKKRSSKWISSCFLKSQLDSEISQYGSADYYAHNLINPVLFEESCEELPKNGLTIEIAPHALMLPIVKSALKEGIHIGITKRGNLDGVNYFLQNMGEAFFNGVDFDISPIYPPIEFPVSRGTRGISSSIKWNHSDDWFIPDYTISTSTGGNKLTISLKDDKFKHIKGYNLNGKTPIPISTYIGIIWESFIAKDQSVEFTDLKFLKQIFITEDEDVNLDFIIQSGSGYFEITHDSEIICTGMIKCSEGSRFKEIVSPNEEITLNQEEFYNELSIRGYNLKESFRSVSTANYKGLRGLVEWKNEWVSFLDNMVQIFMIGMDTRDVYIPRSINKLVLRPLKIEDQLINVMCCRKRKLITCPLAELTGLNLARLTKEKPVLKSILQSQTFVPFNVNSMSPLNAASVIVQLYLENNNNDSLKLAEVENTIIEKFQKALEDIPNVSASFHRDLKEKAYDILISSNIEDVSFLCEGGYLVLKSLEDNLDINNLCQISKIKLNDETGYLLILRKPISQPSIGNHRTIVLNPSKSESWMENMKEQIAEKPSINILQTENGSKYLEMVKNNFTVNELGNIFIQDSDIKPDFYKSQLEKGLFVNVYKNGSWGTYRNLYLTEVDNNSSTVQKQIFAKVDEVGDISSLKWCESPIPNNPSNIEVVYSGLNRRDLSIASGKIESEHDSRINKECSIGIEFSGIHKKSYKRIMGLVADSGITSVISSSPICWEVPESWNLQEAATIPFAYASVYYSLFHQIQIKRGQAIFVNPGTSSIGLAAIKVAASYGLDVYTSCSDSEKLKYLLKLFPQLRESNIAIKDSYEDMILSKTDLKGVDIIVNTCTENNLISLVRCLAEGGTLLEYGNLDTSNSSLGFSEFSRNVSIKPICLKPLLKNAQNAITQKIRDMIIKDINKGIIKPLPSSTFKSKDLVESFEYLEKGNNIGKVLVQVREDQMENKLLNVAVNPMVHLRSDNLYIILGDFGVFNLEFVDWMILRGARKFIFYTKDNLKSSYQQYRMSTWTSYGCEITICDANLSEQNLAEYSKHYEIGGVFDLYKTYYSDIKLLDKLSRISFPKVEYFVVFGYSSEENVSKKDVIFDRILYGLSGKFVQMDMDNISSCISDLDYLLGNIYNEVSRKVISKDHSSVETKTITILDSVLSIMGIADAGSLGLQSTLNDIGCDSVMTRTIKAKFKQDYGLDMSDEEIRLLSIQKIMEMSKKYFKTESLANTKMTTILDSVLTIMGISDPGSVSLQSSLNDLGCDSVMTRTIKSAFKHDYGLEMSDEEIKLLSIQKIMEMSKKYFKAQTTEKVENFTILDSVLSIMGISDPGSVSLQSSLNDLGCDSVMTRTIKASFKHDYGLEMSDEEIKLLSIHQVTEMAKKYFKTP